MERQEAVDEEEMVVMLRNWFDLEEGEPDSTLSEKVAAVLDDWIEVRKVMEYFRCSYRDVMNAVAWMMPEKLTKEKLQELLRKHRPLRTVLDEDGFVRESDLEQDLRKSKEKLRKHFYLTDDRELSKAMLKTYRSFFDVLDMVVDSGVHLWTSLMIYEQLNPGCFRSESFRKLVSQLYSQR